MRGAAAIRIAMLEAQKAAIRNEHKGEWRNTSRIEREEKIFEEVNEYIDATWDDASEEERLSELGDAIWTLIQHADNEGLLGTSGEAREEDHG